MVRYLALAAFALLGCAACTRTELDVHTSGTIREPMDLGLRNDVVVHVDPAGHEVTADVKAFNVVHGSAFQVPWDELTLTCGSEAYAISTKGLGNNEILVNGTKYQFDTDTYDYRSSGPVLSIRFGGAIVVGAGILYEEAIPATDAF